MPAPLSVEEATGIVKRAVARSFPVDVVVEGIRTTSFYVTIPATQQVFEINVREVK